MDPSRAASLWWNHQYGPQASRFGGWEWCQWGELLLGSPMLVSSASTDHFLLIYGCFKFWWCLASAASTVSVYYEWWFWHYWLELVIGIQKLLSSSQLAFYFLRYSCFNFYWLCQRNLPWTGMLNGEKSITHSSKQHQSRTNTIIVIITTHSAHFKNEILPHWMSWPLNKRAECGPNWMSWPLNKRGRPSVGLRPSKRSLTILRSWWDAPKDWQQCID